MTKFKMLVLTGVLLLSKGSFALNLPVVTDSQLTVGAHWTWNYFEKGDFQRVYSAERYQVIERKGSFVTFEIRSRYDGQSDFIPNTRFRVNLENCHQAFQNPDVKVNFMISLYSMNYGEWESIPIWTHATAFEEKFNCNPIFHDKKNSIYQTRFAIGDWSGNWVELFQQWPKSSNSQIRSYYFLEHSDLRGVAYKREFNPDSPNFFEMRLTDWGR